MDARNGEQTGGAERAALTCLWKECQTTSAVPVGVGVAAEPWTTLPCAKASLPKTFVLWQIQGKCARCVNTWELGWAGLTPGLTSTVLKSTACAASRVLIVMCWHRVGRASCFLLC